MVDADGVLRYMRRRLLEVQSKMPRPSRRAFRFQNTPFYLLAGIALRGFFWRSAAAMVFAPSSQLAEIVTAAPRGHGAALRAQYGGCRQPGAVLWQIGCGKDMIGDS